ncbi:MAG TPA: MraY family glycosyltransferase [Rhizomicrobium sp.]|jgi:UDP-GlcNAc:undecaprenyl-phosphate GlcNAc-1-phosphate transferase
MAFAWGPHYKFAMLLEYLPILLTIIVCEFADPLGRWLGVIDHPDADRKSHGRPTAMVGGLAIMLPLSLWAMIELIQGHGDQTGFYLSLLLCGGGVAILGFMDDQRTISAGGRLLLLAIFSLVALRLDPALSGDRIMTASHHWIAIPPYVLPSVTVIALTGFSSAVNLTDGLNGLVLALVLIWTFCLVWLGDPLASGAASIIAATGLITLLYNVRGRLFLGDCGAFAIAFCVGILAVHCHNAGRLPLETAFVWFLLPVVDCLRLIPLRIRKGRSPFQPDREHFHYRLSARLGEPGATAAYAGTVAVTSAAAVWLPQGWAFCAAAALAVYGGFLLADALAPKTNVRSGEAEAPENIVRLGKRSSKDG